MANNLAPIIEELRRAYEVIRDEVFQTSAFERAVWDYANPSGPRHTSQSPQMPMPVITVQARGRKHVDGWYKPAAWNSQSADAINVLAGTTVQGTNLASTDEICIAAEALGKPSQEILTILTHQMVHHMQASNPKMYSGDTQNKNGYHTWTFRSLAETAGLRVSQDKSRGWSNTEPNRMLKDVFEDKVKLNEDAFDMFRKGTIERERVGSKLKKWQCKCTNIRSAVYIDAVCQICGDHFNYADKDKDEQDVIDQLTRSAQRIVTSQKYYGYGRRAIKK